MCGLFSQQPLVEKRDQLIFVITKADEQTAMIANAIQPNVDAFRSALTARPGFSGVVRALRDQRHGVIVVPFSAGRVLATAPGKPDAFVFGHDAWPQRLWDELREAIQGRGFVAGAKALFGRG